jgi:hypothetical protein
METDRSNVRQIVRRDKEEDKVMLRQLVKTDICMETDLK